MTALFAPGGVEGRHHRLVLTTGLAPIIGTFFRSSPGVSTPRPEDYEEAEISDGAGELGFFSPHSWWPILIALAFSTAAVGAALWLTWLIAAGLVMVLGAVAGLVFEYYVGPEKHWALRRVTIGASLAPGTVCWRARTARFGSVLPG